MPTGVKGGIPKSFSQPQISPQLNGSVISGGSSPPITQRHDVPLWLEALGNSRNQEECTMMHPLRKSKLNVIGSAMNSLPSNQRD